MFNISAGTCSASQPNSSATGPCATASSALSLRVGFGPRLQLDSVVQIIPLNVSGEAYPAI